MSPLDTGRQANADRDTLDARFLRVFPAFALPIFLAAIDQTIVATALPTLAAALGEVERVSWVIVTYLIAVTVAAPVYGRLGDAFGRRRMLLTALAVFLVASVLCALAPTMTTLAAARLLQGFGGGGLITLAQAMLGEVLPPRERGRYQGYIAAVWVASSTFGPVAGGWLTQAFGWQSIFWVNLPIGAIAAWLVAATPRRPAPADTQPFRFDAAGMLLFAGFVGGALLALENAQRFAAAAAPMAVLSAVIALASLIALLWWERRARDPLLPLSLLADPVIWRADSIAAVIGGATVGLISFVPIYLEAVRGIGPGEIGLVMLPLTVGGSIGAMLTGRLMASTGRTMLWPSIGLPIAALLLVVLATQAQYLPTSALPWLLGVISFAMGSSYPVIQITVQIAAGRERLGSASASIQFSRSLGSAFGTAIMGAVLFAALAIADPQMAGLFGRLVDEGPALLPTLGPDQRAALDSALQGGFRAAFVGSALMTAAGAWLALRAPSRRI